MKGFIYSKSTKELLFSDNLKEDIKPIYDTYGEIKTKEKFVFIILNENNDQIIDNIIKNIKDNE